MGGGGGAGGREEVWFPVYNMIVYRGRCVSGIFTDYTKFHPALPIAIRNILPGSNAGEREREGVEEVEEQFYLYSNKI